jgi:hypothetical protein
MYFGVEMRTFAGQMCAKERRVFGPKEKLAGGNQSVSGSFAESCSSILPSVPTCKMRYIDRKLTIE